jgi:hypothetical protein
MDNSPDTGSLDDVVELVVWIPTEDEVSLAGSKELGKLPSGDE